jgi:hypothetical protein
LLDLGWDINNNGTVDLIVDESKEVVEAVAAAVGGGGRGVVGCPRRAILGIVDLSLLSQNLSTWFDGNI